MKLTDNCPVHAESKPLKEYQPIPKTMCPVRAEPAPKEPLEPTIKTVTEYYLRAYMKKVATSKCCAVPPHDCS